VYSVQQWTLPSDLTCADIDLDTVTQFTEVAMQDVSAGCNCRRHAGMPPAKTSIGLTPCYAGCMQVAAKLGLAITIIKSLCNGPSNTRRLLAGRRSRIAQIFAATENAGDNYVSAALATRSGWVLAAV
jgi:hypothetical protein